MRIGIDLMGGDAPPQSLFPAVLQAAETLGDTCTFLVIATQALADQFRSLVPHVRSQKNNPAIEFHVVADAITMADDPLAAVRRKKDSSLVVGIRLLKKGQLAALVSCGNTGALIAAAAFALPMLPGIDRPGLLALLPTAKGPLAVLDVGGSVQCKARQLVQFAHYGAAYQRIAQGMAVPRVGLLNVGAESKKGTQEIRQAYEILQAEWQAAKAGGSLHFAGNIEARDVFGGGVDVLVTDGFTGNVLLKAAEGVASFIFASLKQAAAKEGAAAVEKLLAETQKQFSYAEYPGAIVCGIEGLVVKAHGNASAKALCKSIVAAAQLLSNNTISRIKQALKTSV